jgi:hypothetical protein
MRRTINPYLSFMRTKPVLILGGIIISVAANAQPIHVGQEGWWGSHWNTDSGISKYNAQELTFDAFGTYINPERQFDKVTALPAGLAFSRMPASSGATKARPTTAWGFEPDSDSACKASSAPSRGPGEH